MNLNGSLNKTKITKNHSNGYSRAIVVVIVVVFFCGLALGYWLRSHHRFNFQNNPSAKSKQYPYLAKRIFVDDPNATILNFLKLRTSLQEYTEQVNNESAPGFLSLYFEYLPTGISIGIDASHPFPSASLIKVPTAMAVFNEIQNGQLKFTDMLTIQQQDIDLRSGNLGAMGAGTKISLADAVALTLIDSDNTGQNLLLSTIHLKDIYRVYDFIDIPLSTDGTSTLTSPKNYSSIFKSLYFASYLSVELSNKMLGLLTKVSFKEGIRAGVPASIPMAHKFGIFITPDSQKVGSFSNCGIVYLPKRNYILCVMTSHIPEESADKYMAHISQVVYDFTSSASMAP